MNQFYYTVTLQAGVDYIAPYGGKYFALNDCGTARSVDVTLSHDGQQSAKMSAMTAGFQVEGDFDKVILNSPTVTTVSFFASQKQIKLGNKDGLVVSVPGGVKVTNTAGEAIPVLFGGTVAPVVGTISNTNAQAIPVQRQTLTTIVDIAPVTVGTVAASISNDATLKRLRIRNSHATAIVGIGGVGVTLANAAIVLQPGDLWIEDDCAPANWYAISDTATTVIQMQGVK